jgi:peptidoglycan biosynthesis protein MviN/MurJ (putative lipid II flippase)
MLARWTSHITTTGVAPARRDVLRVLGKGLGLAAGIASILALFATPLVQVVLGHGRFTPADARTVATVLRALSLAYVANMGASLLERYYIALMRNRTLAALSVGRAALRLGTVWLLLRGHGLLAFPIGFAVSEWTYVVILSLLMTEAQAGRGVRAG